MMIKDCTLCGGTHYGSHKCPYQCDTCKVKTGECKRVDCARNSRWLAEQAATPIGRPDHRKPVNSDDAEFGMSDHRRGCGNAILSYSSTTGGVSCTKCAAYARHGEDLKCAWPNPPAIVAFAMSQRSSGQLAAQAETDRMILEDAMAYRVLRTTGICDGKHHLRITDEVDAEIKTAMYKDFPSN